MCANVKDESFQELEFSDQYRDNIFVIWLGTMNHLNRLPDFINLLDEKLKFTMEFSDDFICFLDLKISIGNWLYTTVYNKPTDGHYVLTWKFLP